MHFNQYALQPAHVSDREGLFTDVFDEGVGHVSADTTPQVSVAVSSCSPCPPGHSFNPAAGPVCARADTGAFCERAGAGDESYYNPDWEAYGDNPPGDMHRLGRCELCAPGAAPSPPLVVCCTPARTPA